MDFNIVINNILTSIVVGAIPLLVALALKYIQKGIQWLEAKTKDSTLQNIYSRLDDAVVDSVQMIENTLVKAAKATNTWTPEKAKETFGIAYNDIIKALGNNSINFLKESEIDIVTLVTNKIEAYNKNLNKN
jgi:hypothetical protein